MSDQAEALGGFRPAPKDVLDFLRTLDGPRSALEMPTSNGTPTFTSSAPEAVRASAKSRSNRSVEYSVNGETRTAKNANQALVEILARISQRDIERIPALAKAVQGNSRNHIARTVQEIYPARPDLARAEEFAPGWLVGLNIANREKIGIIRKACEVFGVTFGTEVKISLPNE